jgi:hypothetical protein
MKIVPRTASPSASLVIIAIAVIAHKSADPTKAIAKPAVPNHP